MRAGKDSFNIDSGVRKQARGAELRRINGGQSEHSA